MNNNVNSAAKIISTTDTQAYTLGTFLNNVAHTNDVSTQNNNSIQYPQIVNPQHAHSQNDQTLQEIQKLTQHLVRLEAQVTNIVNNGVQAKDLDKQIIQALKDLKNYATFFEQATFQLETKILKTSMSIAKKIIGVEIGAQSSNIAKETIFNILNKIKTASKITIHLSPKDYIILKNELNLDSFIQLQEDSNVTPGGVVIASDLGNFDGNIEAKVQTILESLDTLM